MSSPSKFRAVSPVRTLEERFYSKPLEVILEENNALRLSNSLIYQNKFLEKENQRLIQEVAKSKDGQTYNYTENLKLLKEKEELEYNFRSLEAASVAQNEAKERQLQSQERDIRLLRDEYTRENQTLKDQIISLTKKIGLIEASKNAELDDIKKKCLNATSEQTEFLRKNLSQELMKVVGELELTKKLLFQKQKQNEHLVLLNQQASAQYTINLQNLISENNILRNQLITLQRDKNKEIEQAENKKALQKSRTIGILSYCKENNQFMEKQLTRLAEQLLEKNISIESFTKQLLKQKKQSQHNERKHEQTLSKVKLDLEEQVREKEKQIQKLEKTHKENITQFKKRELDLEEQLASRLNELDNMQRQVAHVKEQVKQKDKQIQDLKETIGRMHEDHSKELSKVMLDSRVKRRSGMNISSYSSSSLKDIEQAQGSSIIKAQSLQRKNSSHQVLTPSGLPVVKEELAVSHGHIEDQQEDIQIKQLILHYESMIEELKKNKANELSVASQKIETLRLHLEQKQQQLMETLNRFKPLMELKTNRASIDQERRAKIEQTQKADIAILHVMLQKYGIVSLQSRNR